MQYIAKLYSEGLGRVPDQAGWAMNRDYVKASRCSAKSLQAIAIGVLSSEEAQSLGYSPEEKVLTYYRSLLSRDPDQSGLAYWVATMRAGKPNAEVVTAIATSAEAVTYQIKSCFSSSQGFSSGIPAPTMTGTELQTALDNLPRGGVLTLDARSTIITDKPIIIGRETTLQTAGNPSPRLYARQARIVRSGDFNGPLVIVSPGARLQSIWVDGQRSLQAYTQAKYNVSVKGGFGSAVLNSKISDTAGATGIEFRNAPETFKIEGDRRCYWNQAIGNILTSYSSNQATRQWADGLSVHCEDVTVKDNSVIDATDVAIILFSYPSPWLDGAIAPQRSRVTGNTILNAGNNAFAALAVDPFFTWERINNKPVVGDAIGVASRNFIGARIEDNLLWTSETASYEIGIAIGTRPWFNINSYTGRGGSYSRNSTGILKAKVDFGIVVSGMLDVTVKDNQLLLDVSDFSRCPFSSETQASRAKTSPRAGNIGLGADFASGDIQGAGTQVIGPFVDCVGKRIP
jgi:hypothetical protein